MLGNLMGVNSIGVCYAMTDYWPDNFWLHWLVFTLIIILFVLATVIMYIWFERRLIGRFQIRIGPNRVGPFGLFQAIADVVKILTKEDIVPKAADRLVFWLAPLVTLTPVLMVFAVVPLWNGAILADLNIGILYVIALSSIASIGIFMAGWGSNNKYSLIGAMRDVAQLISYEIPLVLSIVGVILVAGSLSLTEIIKAQSVPFILLQPLGFFIFFVGSLAEINRCPFDLVEAESEIIAGYNIEYSGSKFATFFLAEYSEAVVVSVLTTILFLGGWSGPLLPPLIWLLIKMFVVFALIVWIRSTLPRFRIDQMMDFAWKFLLPLSLINLFLTSFQIVFWPDASVWLIVLINFAVILFLALASSRFFKPGGSKIEI